MQSALSVNEIGRDPVNKPFREATHRARPPELTLAAYQPLMPHLGITRLANITGLDCIGIPVVVAVRPASRGLATAQGKGIDLVSAKVSALMEAIETWHAERLERVTRFEPLAEIQREAEVIDVSRLQRRSGRVVNDRTPMCWVEGRDLMSGAGRWVPWEAVSCDFSAAVVRNSTFLQTTNGLASGNHLIEATIHALCELIERDAITLHQRADRASRDRRRIDLGTVHDPYCRLALEKLSNAGVDVTVWDCTSDVGIPVFSALIMDSPAAQRLPARGAFRGYGCHPARAVALLRALTEAVQSRLTYISGSRDDLFPERFREVQRLEEERVVKTAGAERGRVSFAAVREFQNATFDDDLEFVLDRLRSIGLKEVVSVDLTRKDLDVPVVKVLVPGLENNIHRDPGYCAGHRAQTARAVSP